MMHGWHGGWTPAGFTYGLPWGGVFIGIFALALLVLLAVIAVRLGKNRKQDLQDLKDKGIDILIERYTKGEINADTFRTMKAELDAKV